MRLDRDIQKETQQRSSLMDRIHKVSYSTISKCASDILLHFKVLKLNVFGKHYNDICIYFFVLRSDTYTYNDKKQYSVFPHCVAEHHVENSPANLPDGQHQLAGPAGYFLFTLLPVWVVWEPAGSLGVSASTSKEKLCSHFPH